MVVRKTGSVKLEAGTNKLQLPVGAQIIGFDAVGQLRAVYDAPGDMFGTTPVELVVVPAGEEFKVDADGYQVLGTASPTGSRPVIVYQVFNFPG